MQGVALEIWLAASLWSLAAAGATVLCCLLCLQWYNKLRSVKRVKSGSASSCSSSSPPLPPGHSFGWFCITETVLCLLAFAAGNLGSFVRARTPKLGSKTFRTSLLFQPAVFVQGEAANRFIALAEHKKQLFNSLPASVLQILGEHIPLAMHGAPHRRLRQIIVSCVSPLALQNLTPRADLMTRLHFQSCWHVTSQIELFPLIKEHTFRVACSLLAGTEDQALLARMHRQFSAWSAGVFTFPLDLPGTTFHKAKKARNLLVRELSTLIDRAQEKGAGGGGAGNEDILSMLLGASDENGSFLTRNELKDVLLFLLFAGHDTAAATLAFALKFLEQHPACYHHLCQEHKAIASQKNEKETLNWSDIQNMTYTWAVIQETLRLRPVGVGAVREVGEDINFDGCKIPKGWKVLYTMSATHEDGTFFQEPSKFEPSRFHINGLKDGYTPPPYVYIPFGIGPHSCPGGNFARMLISIYLHHLALGPFKWQSCDPNEKIHCFPLPKPAKDYVAKVFLGCD